MTQRLFDATIQVAAAAALGENVVFQPMPRPAQPVGPPFSARGIFDAAHQELSVGEAEISTISPVLKVRIAGVAAAALKAGWPPGFRPRRLDRLFLRGETWEVVDVQPDGPDVGLDLIIERLVG